MSIKGISTLEYYLTNWLKDQGFPDVKARVAADFQYGPDEETIYFALAITEEQDKKFLTFCQEMMHFPYDCDNFILSFFHELGHHNTWELWSEIDWDYYNTAKEIINFAGLPVEEYFQLPQEWFATKWGCDYICKNVEKIEEFWRVCQKLLMNIYKQNGVEIE